MTTKNIRSKYHWHTTFAKRNQSALYADRFQSSFWHILIGKSPMLITLLSKWWQILAIIQIWWLSPSQLQKMETQINHIPKSTIYKISPINPPLFSDHQLRSTSRSCRSAARSCRNSERKPGLLGGDIDMARFAADTSLGGFSFLGELSLRSTQFLLDNSDMIWSSYDGNSWNLGIFWIYELPHVGGAQKICAVLGPWLQ